jgi:hypothetical protein
MKLILGAILACLLVIVGFLGWLVVFDSKRPLHDDQSSVNAIPATVWEYKIESPSDSALEQTLNVLGTQGWELVFARRAQEGAGNAMSYEMIFRRPIAAANVPSHIQELKAKVDERLKDLEEQKKERDLRQAVPGR